MTLYKAVRPDGTDFRTGKINYLTGGTIAHPNPGKRGSEDAHEYLSVSTTPTDCTGVSWPARLLEVEAVGATWKPHSDELPNKRAVKALRVVRELDAHLVLGPQGEQIAALIERARALTGPELDRVAAAWAAAWAAARAAARDAAWAAAGDAARAAARDAAWAAAWAAAGDAARAAARDAAWAAARDAARAAARAAALGLTVRDLITTEHYDKLTMPWRRAIGRIHPDDAEVTR